MEGVAADQALLRPRVYSLGGAAGVARLDARLAEVRAAASAGPAPLQVGCPASFAVARDSSHHSQLIFPLTVLCCLPTRSLRGMFPERSNTVCRYRHAGRSVGSRPAPSLLQWSSHAVGREQHLAYWIAFLPGPPSHCSFWVGPAHLVVSSWRACKLCPGIQHRLPDLQQGPATPPRPAPQQPRRCRTPPRSPEGRRAGRERPAAGPEGAAAAQRARLVWELLHDPCFSLPTLDAEAAWSDAIGDTSVMKASPHVAACLGIRGHGTDGLCPIKFLLSLSGSARVRLPWCLRDLTVAVDGAFVSAPVRFRAASEGDYTACGRRRRRLWTPGTWDPTRRPRWRGGCGEWRSRPSGTA